MCVITSGWGGVGVCKGQMAAVRGSAAASGSQRCLCACVCNVYKIPDREAALIHTKLIQTHVSGRQLHTLHTAALTILCHCASNALPKLDSDGAPSICRPRVAPVGVCWVGG